MTHIFKACHICYLVQFVNIDSKIWRFFFTRNLLNKLTVFTEWWLFFQFQYNLFLIIKHWWEINPEKSILQFPECIPKCNTSSICYQDQSPRNEQASITITSHKKHIHTDMLSHSYPMGFPNPLVVTIWPIQYFDSANDVHACPSAEPVLNKCYGSYQ